MDYIYESLGPDRFQKLCQALLTHEFKNLQCFPVSEPDGGRDAAEFIDEDEIYSKPFLVFQVKWIANPFDKKAGQKLLAQLKDELPTIQGLIPNGAKAYYLLTNVRGSATSGTGTIDKVQELLEGLAIPKAQCWWRDDIDRRLDGAWAVKWRYPDVMLGVDMLRYVVENGLTEHASRRMATIRAFLRTQYEEEKKIRFKQVDLHNDLLALFTDVPVTVRGSAEESCGNAILDNVIDEYDGEDPDPKGAAAMLLQEDFQQIVLEGAPGQGKSTITQFVCQVNRMAILGMEKGLEGLPEYHRPSGVRIPIRVELRNLATWLRKRDPFSDDDRPATGWEKSLESFLCAQIRHDSGGDEFSGSDLRAVAGVSALLLVLDGLDEVPDMSQWEEVVAAVSVGVSRLRDSSASLQVIITSRPAVFTNSPRFSRQDFPHIMLDALSPTLIEQYASKWTRAKEDLQAREAAQFVGDLVAKLEQPHVQELAKNPMQLAILLNLMHTMGESLPDKRTALYSTYVDFYFRREAAKSPVVREYRDLLINIHGHIAWHLHMESEQGTSGGRIGFSELRSVVAEYLTLIGSETSVVETLFRNMLVRVVFLVPRVLGTYEFEVQPLREYFAARHIHDMAPTSATGFERTGTRPERFEVVARHFYWLNVARFLAGRFGVGELFSLVYVLRKLANDEEYRLTSHPQSLTSMLLSDWVFAQYPDCMKEAVQLLVEGMNRRRFLNSTGYGRHRTNVALPVPYGRKELTANAFRLLKTAVNTDYVNELTGVIRANSETADAVDMWYSGLFEMGESETNSWVEKGQRLGILGLLVDERVHQVVKRSGCDQRVLATLLRGGQGKLIQQSEALTARVLDSILDGTLEFTARGAGDSVLDRVARLFAIGENFRRAHASYAGSLRGLFGIPENRPEEQEHNGSVAECNVFLRHVEPLLDRPVREWVGSMELWDSVVERARQLWGQRFATELTANAVVLHASQDLFANYDNLFDNAASLFGRIAHAKRRWEKSWWAQQAALAQTMEQRRLFTLVMTTWMPSSLLSQVPDFLEPMLDGLDPQSWRRIARASRTVGMRFARPRRPNIVAPLPDRMSPRLAYVMSFKGHLEEDIYAKYLRDYNGPDRVIEEFIQKIAIDRLLRGAGLDDLQKVKDTYCRGIVWERTGVTQSADLTVEAAREITAHPDCFPRDLVALAEDVCRRVIAASLEPVGEIARRNEWFSLRRPRMLE